MEENFKETIQKRKLECFVKESPEVLKTRVQKGKRAQELKNCGYWTELEAEYRAEIKEYYDRKSYFTFMGEITNPEESAKVKGQLLQAEAIAFVKLDILDRVESHIDDGRLAERVLSKGSVAMEVK
jgi:hypothetical protein